MNPYVALALIAGIAYAGAKVKSKQVGTLTPAESPVLNAKLNPPYKLGLKIPTITANGISSSSSGSGFQGDAATGGFGSGGSGATFGGGFHAAWK